MFLAATMVLPKFGYNLIVIKSGSMEPTIKTGSVTIIQKNNNYNKGDIITFKENAKSLVTHRITQVKNEEAIVSYKTKGDNNNTDDIKPVLRSSVIGKTLFVIPYFGWVIGFLKTKIGVIILILIPTIYFITLEILKIKNVLKKRKEN
jgi:signal peptidase